MKQLILCATWICMSVCCLAETTADFTDIVSKIESNNTSIAVSEHNINTEKAMLSSLNNLSDPEAEFSHQWGQRGIGNKWSVGISQSFEWPGVYSSREKQIFSEKSALSKLHLEKKRQVRLEIRRTLIDIVYYKQLLSLMQSQLKRIDSLYSISLKGASMGEISKLDINKLKIERINVSRELCDAENSLSETCLKLTELNGGNNCSELVSRICSFPNEQLQTMEYYKSNSHQNDPTKAYREYMADASNYEKQVLQRSNIPSFSVGYNHDYELGEHFNGVSLGLTIPVFSNRHKKAEIESRQILLVAEQIDAENRINTVVETSYSQVLSLDREISLYGSVLKDSDNIRLLDIALKSGHITLIEYLLEINYFMDAHKYLLDVTRQRAIRMSELTQWTEC